MKHLKLALLAVFPCLLSAQISGVTIHSASTGFSTRVADNTINGSGLTSGTHDNDFNNMWLVSLSSFPSPEIVFDLGANYDVSGIHVWNYFESSQASRGMNSVTISYDMTSGASSFTSVGAYNFASESTGLGSSVSIPTLSNARLIKFEMGSTHGSATFAGLSEVQFTASAVPEPSSFGVLAGFATLVLVAFRRRTRASLLR